MVRLMGTVFGIAALAYLAVVAIAWVLQGKLIYPAPSTVGPIPPAYTEITLETQDGLRLRAGWRPPVDTDRVILFFHGNGDDLAGSALAMRTLAEAGYGVLLLNYRGYSGNPGTPDEAGLYKDGRAALRWLNGQGIDPANIIYVGNSIGSGPATQLASESTPGALILISPFTSLPDIVAEKTAWLPVRAIIRDRFDNVSKIGRVKAPVLIQHGARDTLIPARHGRALSALARDSEFQLVADAGHELAYLSEAQSAQLDWLNALHR